MQKLFNNLRKHQVALLIVFPALVLLYTGFMKWWDFPKTHMQLRASPLPVITEIAKPLAWVLPGIELLVVMLLVFEAARSLGLLLAALLFFVFTVYVFYLKAGPPGSFCACGGIIGSLNWWQHITLTIVCGMLCLIAWFQNRRRSTVLKS